MFSFFRRGLTAKIMLVFLGLALFAMVITGFGTGGSGIGGIGGAGGSVARVGGEPVEAADVTDLVNRELSRARQERPELDIATFLRGGALEEIVKQLISSTAMVVFGREHGFAASVEMINREIATIPGFQNMAGQFDQATFQRALQTEKITEARLREELEEMLIQRQMVLPVAGSAQVPRSIALQYASLLLETRSGSVGLVATQAMGPGREPTEAEINAFYTSNRTRYVVPERRVLRYAVFGREQVAAAAKPSEAEIAAAYRANAARYAASSTRNLSQVIVPDEAGARALAAKVTAGTTLAQAAAQAGLSPLTLSAQTKEGFQRQTSAAVANAAFAAAKGAVTAPVRSGLGWHVVRVDEITTTPARPLDAVRGEIAAGLEQEKSQEALAALATRVEDQIAEGSNFDDVVRGEKLVVRETAPITATGTAPGVAGWQTPPEVSPMLEAAFEMSPEDDPAVEVIQPDERFALLAVGRVVPAAAPPLAQIKDRLKADLAAKRANDRARSVATSILAKINAGMTPAQAFAQAEMRLAPVQTITARRMDIAQRSRQVPPPLQLMFSLPRGKARLLAAPNGAGWFIVHLDKVVPGDARNSPELIEATRTQFGEVLGSEYAQQFTRAVESATKIERNEEAIRAVRTTLAGGTAR